MLKGFGVNPHGNLTGLYAKATQVMLCLSYAELSKLRKLACLLELSKCHPPSPRHFRKVLADLLSKGTCMRAHITNRGGG